MAEIFSVGGFRHRPITANSCRSECDELFRNYKLGAEMEFSERELELIAKAKKKLPT